MKNKLKVLIVVHHFPPHVSGVGRVAQMQADNLEAVGVNVTVLTSHCSDKPGTLKSERGYYVHRLKAFNFMEEKKGAPFPIFSPLIIWEAYKLVKNTDIVHVHDAFYISSIVASFWAVILRKPLFLTQHVDMIPHPSKTVILAQRLAYASTGAFIFHKSKKIMVYNERVRRFLIKRGVDKSKILSVINGVDLKIFHPAKKGEKVLIRRKFKLPTNKPLALFVGRYVPKKGFHKLLKSGNEKYTLVFAGGDVDTRLQSENKIFLGVLSQSQTAELYRACDVFVLPSEGEGFPLSIQEAMASGLPIITSDDEGYSSYNFDRNLLHLISPSIKEIKKHLSQVIDDNILRHAMSRYSLNYTEEHFSWDMTIREITEQYRKAIA